MAMVARARARLLSLRSKLALLMSALLLVVALFLLAFFPSRLNSLARDAIEQRGTSMAVLLADGAAAGLEFDDPVAVGNLLATLSTAPDVVYCAVRREDGRVFA